MSDKSIVARRVHEGLATAATNTRVQALRKHRSMSDEPFPREATRAAAGAAAQELRRRIGPGDLDLECLAAWPGRVEPGHVEPRERVRFVRSGADSGVPETSQRPWLQVPVKRRWRSRDRGFHALRAAFGREREGVKEGGEMGEDGME